MGCKPKQPWIIAHDAAQGEDAYALECLHCGDKQRFRTPLSVQIWLAASKVFQRQHARCEPRPAATETPPSPPPCGPLPHAVSAARSAAAGLGSSTEY